MERFELPRELVAKATSSLAIVAIALPASAQAPRTLTITRDLKIDAATQDFTSIRKLVVARDGSIGVWQDKDSKILFFDSKGTSLGSVGRKGSGPGEFQYLGEGGFFGDTLWEGERGRITLISPEHKFVRTLVPPPRIKATETDSVGLPVSSVSVRAIVPDGRFVTTGYLRKNGPHPSWAPPTEERLPVVLTSRSGVFEKLVGWLPQPFAPQCTVTVSSPQMEGILGVPYCAVPIGEWGQDGSRIAAVTQSNGTGAAAHYDVEVTNTSGATVFRRSYSYTPIAIPKRVIDSNLAMRIDPRNKQPAEFEAAWKAMKTPSTYPPVKRLVIGTDGTIWLEMETAALGHRWQLLSAKGDVVGQVSLPQNVELKAVSRSEVWGIEKDQDDLESVVRYKVGP